MFMTNKVQRDEVHDRDESTETGLHALRVSDSIFSSISQHVKQPLIEKTAIKTNSQQIEVDTSTVTNLEKDESSNASRKSTSLWLSICINQENKNEEEYRPQPLIPVKRGRGRPRLKDKPTTNSERGKELRERRTLAASKLVTDVGILKSHVDELSLYRNLLHQKVLRRNAMFDGSYVLGVVQYMKMFQRGCPKTSIHKDALQTQSKQAQFLKSFMTSDVAIINSISGTMVKGLANIFDQWNRHSMIHASFGIQPGTITVISANPTPIVHVQTALSVRFSRATTEVYYHHLLPYNAVIHNLIGLQVQFAFNMKFHFNEDGYVFSFEVDIDCLTGLVQALGNIDIAIALVSTTINQAPICYMLPELKQLALSNLEKEVILPFHEVVSLKF